MACKKQFNFIQILQKYPLEAEEIKEQGVANLWCRTEEGKFITCHNTSHEVRCPGYEETPIVEVPVPDAYRVDFMKIFGNLQDFLNKHAVDGYVLDRIVPHGGKMLVIMKYDRILNSLADRISQLECLLREAYEEMKEKEQS